VEFTDLRATTLPISEAADVFGKTLRVGNLQPCVTDRILQLRDPGLNLEQAHLLEICRAEARDPGQIVSGCRR
jgi:hypothetical protein